MQHWFRQLECLEFVRTPDHLVEDNDAAICELYEPDLEYYREQFEKVSYNSLLHTCNSPRVFSSRLNDIESDHSLFQRLTCFAHTWGPLNTVTEIAFAVLDEMGDDISIDEKWFKDFASRLGLRSLLPNLSRMIFGNIDWAKKRPSCENAMPPR